MRTKEITKGIVGGSIGILILIYVWIAPLFLWLKLLFTALGIWEAYTLINKDKEDTISEAVAELAGMTSLVPLLFGAAYGYALGAGYIQDVVVASALAGLLAHFFFSMKQREIKVINEISRQEDIISGDRRNYRNVILRMESEK